MVSTLQSALSLNCPGGPAVFLSAGALYVASQHAPLLFVSCTLIGWLSGNVGGMSRFRPFALRMIFAFPAAQ